MTRKQRNRLRKEIETDALAFHVAQASQAEIDQINISKASFLAMHRAVDALTIRPEHLLIDGNRFVAYPLIPHTCIVKGDAKFLSIAAASVLAKTYRDDLMEKLSEEYPEYRWHENAGYPTPHHRRAIMQNGLTPHHRLTFKCRDLML